MTKIILVPVDGSGYASKAIDFAAGQAKNDEVVIHLLHVVRKINIPEEIRKYVQAEKIEEPPEVFFRERVGKRLLKWAEEEIRKHANEGGFPANKISEIKGMIDPTTSE